MGVPMPADFGTVEDRSFVISNFRLQNGAVMPQAKIVYETDGRPATDRRNAVLIGARPHQQPSRGRAQFGKGQSAGLVGRADRVR